MLYLAQKFRFSKQEQKIFGTLIFFNLTVFKFSSNGFNCKGNINDKY